MVPRTHSEDSDPVLEVSAIGTANLDGEYLQHEAVSPHKAHAIVMDPLTVVVKRESLPPASDATKGATGSAAAASTDNDPNGAATLDHDLAGEETTSITKSRLRAKGAGLFRLLTFVETHRLTTLTFAVGTLLLLLAAVLAVR